MLLLLARPLGGFMARLIEGEPLPALRGVEAGVWRACGIRATEMNWWQYALAILAFNLLGLALLFALLMTQGSLPLNPQGFPGLSGIWRSTPPSASSPTPTGKPTAAKAPSAI